MFGLERLKSLLLSRRGQPAEEIVSGILEGVKKFGAGRAVDDDLTLVVARVTDEQA
jgi:serine phosphatase RsbU (regulator of sigma subunit)